MNLQVAGLLIVGLRQLFSLMNRYHRQSFSLMNRYYWQSVHPRIQCTHVGNEGAGVRRGLCIALLLHLFRFCFLEQGGFVGFIGSLVVPIVLMLSVTLGLPATVGKTSSVVVETSLMARSVCSVKMS